MLDPEANLAPSSPQRRATRWGLRLRSWLLLAVLLLGLAGGYIASASGQTVVLFGLDRRPGDAGRTDVVLLISPRLFGGGLQMLSIPRDTRVRFPDSGSTAKINAAYGRGGPDLALDAVAGVTGLAVARYVTVDFEAVRAVVDAMGGVTVHVDKRMRYTDPYQDLVIDLQPGLQRLSGEQALGFVRYRSDPTGDLARVQRQRTFIRALIAELSAPTNWPRIPAAFLALRQHSETNLSDLELLRFAMACVLAAHQGVRDETLPGRGQRSNGVSYWVHDEASTRQLVQEMFGRPAIPERRSRAGVESS